MTRSILDARIAVWSPMDPADPFLAKIEERAGKYLPMIFFGASAMRAKKAADDWRKAEVEKLAARERALEARMAGLDAARAAKKEATDAAA